MNRLAFIVTKHSMCANIATKKSNAVNISFQFTVSMVYVFPLILVTLMNRIRSEFFFLFFFNRIKPSFEMRFGIFVIFLLVMLGISTKTTTNYSKQIRNGRYFSLLNVKQRYSYIHIWRISVGIFGRMSFGNQILPLNYSSL